MTRDVQTLLVLVELARRASIAALALTFVVSFSGCHRRQPQPTCICPGVVVVGN